MTSLTYSHLSKRFGSRTLLDEVSVTLHGGHCTLLTGKNGAGKTTLMRILAGLEKPEHTCLVHKDGQTQPWKSIRYQLQHWVMYLHQHPYMFSGTVRSNLEFALPAGLNKTQRQAQLAETIEWAGLDALIDSNAKRLSGGECQQVAIARARLRQPKALLLDEPTANMDTEARTRTLLMLNSLRQEQVALLISSHDPRLFSDLADDCLHLTQQRLLPADPTDTTSIAQLPPHHFLSDTQEHRHRA